MIHNHGRNHTMPILNNIEYLSMPQQVEKNKDDIEQLKTDTTKLVYADTDTIPTPSVGGVATYIIVQVTPSDVGMQDLYIGGTQMFLTGLTNKGGTVITISNIAGVLYASNSNGYNTTVPNLIVTSDYVALMKLY